ncbi:MAG: short chain dehydrogenase [Deltaproteobacteria bacterium RIFCSPLOWO2_12_FULL_44_12]|nr:MAG: short chain dehydrogenase [Deltaproteobacteria bacterium RIFCSPHIGHO2_01_FULL_43_49]OGQ16571.1 MAG: short chain dehydrogenase [Deltaproteobacteria bacterium RIFCSPHIGHO2_02_FULL_44_53]OGQ28387.1 MAG: short chain dehydrogenase [Deltaproteobacteria bacterium RIFCSPHIGHO2_12_FULL_44_21]OGQ32458.1 MAG: short chain dehydrogenase [Deltaproteobacteria bacterium RIFCSPLOWO2_01_FULL_45_74]OGQ41584.1 MAG: short chain dehydrogenase [Deltaproteobacteria bacterium RIFCSPLOWO2_02_FULL_44_34]OGQ69517
MVSLKGKTIIITGASRGIGRAIALKCARDGANLVVAGKTKEPHPKLTGTIDSVAKEVEAAGGKAFPVQVDVREESQVKAMVEKTVQTFGCIDILVNNAGAISLTATEDTPMKRYDLMQDINTRATFLCSQAVLPHLKKSKNPHILNLSPPINLDPKWLKNHLAYTLSKYGMTMCTLGMAAEFKEYGIAVNSLWPKTLIATAAIDMLLGEDGKKKCRTPEIMADAAYAIITTDSRKLTGQTLIDEDFLRSRGVKNFDHYSFDPNSNLLPDLFVE